jgi:hypothetical protein
MRFAAKFAASDLVPGGLIAGAAYGCVAEEK